MRGVSLEFAACGGRGIRPTCRFAAPLQFAAPSQFTPLPRIAPLWRFFTPLWRFFTALRRFALAWSLALLRCLVRREQHTGSAPAPLGRGHAPDERNCFELFEVKAHGCHVQVEACREGRGIHPVAVDAGCGDRGKHAATTGRRHGRMESFITDDGHSESRSLSSSAWRDFRV